MRREERKGDMRETRIDRKQYTRMLGIFVRTTRDDVRTLRDAVERADREVTSRTAHHIKGAAEGLELGEIAYNAQFIEERVDRPDKLLELLAICDEIDRQLTSVSRQFGIAEG
jgi:HPt (histidine-containing phosphotransfer) domain-containing protein